MAKNALVLLSGGIDSTACLVYYLGEDYSVSALFVDYGQVSGEAERKAASDVCARYQIPLHGVTISSGRRWREGYIPARNAVLLTIGLMNFSATSGIVAIGIHAGTSYADSSTQFVAEMQSVFDIYAGGMIRIGAPFLRWNKPEIWNYCQVNDVPLKLTYSCERGDKQPCGVCLSCKDLEALYAGKK